MFATTLFAAALVALPFAPDDAANPMTFSQEQWGGKCGKNAATDPGCLRDEHFAELFPKGLVIGASRGATETGPFAITLTSADAVKAFLPKEGDPKRLTQSATDPKKGDVMGGTFAGELVAARLNVAVNDAGLVEGAQGMLSAMVFPESAGALAGKSVSEVLTMANEVFGSVSETRMKDAEIDTDGDGEADLSPNDLVSALKNINKSFEKGKDKGVLVRPPAPAAAADNANKRARGEKEAKAKTRDKQDG